MKYTQFIFIVLLFLTFSCQEGESASVIENESSIKEGYWQGSLILQEYEVIFDFLVDKDQKWTVYNDKEVIALNQLEVIGDSLQITFNSYPNFFKFKVDSSGELNGYFLHPDIGENMKLSFNARYTGKERAKKLKTESPFNVEGNWETRFRPGADNEFPAVGKFTQNNTTVKGTFLKRSGDARFLSGGMNDNILTLTSFDGSYASIYVAELRNDTLYGKQLSGNEGHTEWIAFRNENYKLENPDSLTFMVKDSFKLSLKTIEGEDFVYPNAAYNNKVTIVQIMGTWCPNCLDETVFFKELYEEYNEQGLEIFSVAYERPKTFEEQAARLQRYKDHTHIPYPLLLGSGLSDNKASEDFSMLNRVSAFPTAIFINRKGEVVKIKTGFSGPGTGELYEQTKREIRNFVEELLH